MYLELLDVKGFSRFFNAVSSIVSSDVFIHTSPTHLVINQNNMINTAMVVFSIEKEYFEAYRVEEENIIALDMDAFNKTLKKFDGFKRLRIELDKEDAKLRFYAQDGKRRKQSSLTLVEIPESYHPMSPEMEYPVVLVVNSRELRQSVADSYEIASDESIKFHCNGSELSISLEAEMATNEDTWKVGDNLKVLLSDEATVLLPIDDLYGVVNKSFTLSDNVSLSLMTDMPVSITYTFKNGTMKFFIAPRLL